MYFSKIFVFTFLTHFVQSAPAPISKNGVVMKELFTKNGITYYMALGRSSWESAGDFCESVGMDIANIPVTINSLKKLESDDHIFFWVDGKDPTNPSRCLVLEIVTSVFTFAPCQLPANAICESYSNSYYSRDTNSYKSTNYNSYVKSSGMPVWKIILIVIAVIVLIALVVLFGCGGGCGDDD